MKKCIAYVSQTGYTKEVVDKFDGFDVFKIEDPSDFPNIETYQQVIFACPVHGFRAAKLMKDYLETLSRLQRKVIDIFITHYFRFAFMGGTQTLKQMEKIINSKGGKIRYKTSINRKSNKSNDVMIEIIRKYSKWEV